MNNYIDGFVLPIPKNHLNDYKKISSQIADIWIEYGALGYYEFVGDDLYFEGIKSFVETMGAKTDELILFGWVVFPSKTIRDLANKKVSQDPRMAELMAPLTNRKKVIFDASRMTYGGFYPLVQSIHS